jgi:hypothetical protein
MTNPVLVSVRLSATEIGEVIVEECSVCWALVRKSKIADHMRTHNDH